MNRMKRVEVIEKSEVKDFIIDKSRKIFKHDKPLNKSKTNTRNNYKNKYRIEDSKEYEVAVILHSNSLSNVRANVFY